MLTPEEIMKLIMYGVAGTIAATIRFMRKSKRTINMFIIEFLLGLSFAFFIVPALAEYFSWSMYMATGITWVLTMFSETVLDIIQDKIKDYGNGNNIN